MPGLYIHIPFCLKRCIYCDFYSTTCTDEKDAYLTALLYEMEIRRFEWQDKVFDTIYFGGGTPSTLPPKDLQKIFDGIYRFFSVSAHTEITLEANPDDLTAKYVKSLKMLPVNRISIGIQSFDDNDLRLLNRRHTYQEAIEAVNRCKEAGLENISIDLMYALPGQTTEKWIKTIEKAIMLDVPHISAYSLTYEEGTKIYKMLNNKETIPIEDDFCEQFYQILTAKLTAAGYVHYEISNFARQSAQPCNIFQFSPESSSGFNFQLSHHNASYWNGTHYLGLGPSAHSYDGKSRSWNISSLSKYIDAMRDNSNDFFESERLDERARYNDFLITRLRTMWGISLEELRREFGKVQENAFLEKSEHLINIKKLKKEGKYVKVSHENFYISDAILRELID